MQFPTFIYENYLIYRHYHYHVGLKLTFLLQENTDNSEILSCLKHVRPGNGFVPKFPIFAKVDVNGHEAHPLFSFLRHSLPFPKDDPHTFMGDPKCIIWNPVSRTDIAWNFEKFLIRRDGTPYQRYSRYYQTSNLASDIRALLESPYT